MAKVRCGVTRCFHNKDKQCGREAVAIKQDGLWDTDCADFKEKDRHVK